jgi:predicted permease
LELSELGEPAGSRVQFWLPLAAAAGWRGVPSRGTPWHSMVVRLGPGVTEQIAAVQLTSAAAGITRGAPAATVRVALSPLGAGPGDVPTDIAIMIALFLAVPMSVLAIGCANVANLQLARATARARDAAIRLALGGSRSAVTRLLATEAAILAIIAGFAGTAGTLVVTRLAVSVLPLSLSVDWRVLAFTIALVGLAILLAGVLPAWLATRRATTVGLHQASQAAAVGHARLRQALVAFQVALSLALLVVGALFARSLGAHYAGAPRATSELVVAAVDLDMAGYDGAAARRFLDDVTGRLRADPRIRAAGVHSLRALRYRSVDAQPGADRYGIGRYVTPAWFEAMDVEPLSGRLFTADDGRAAAVVNQRLADRLAPGRPVVGTVIEVRESEGDVPRLVRITGVIPNAPPPPDPQDDPAIYLPMPIEPLLSLTVVVRTAMPAILLRDVARLFSDIDPRLPLIDLSTGEALFARALSPVRYLVLAAGGLGTLALVLAAAGLYAMLSYVVQLRRREIAVRMALGAQPSDVVALVLGQSLRLTLAGLTAGLAIVVPLAFVVRFLFVGVSPIDPAAIGVPAGVLLVAALVAAAAPAAHAAGVDPARVLRRE